MLSFFQKSKITLRPKSFTSFPDKPNTSIVDIHASLFGSKQRKTGYRVVLVSCPFHQEKTPSCALYEDTNSYYCFSCQASGDHISFVQKTQGVGFKEALEIIKNI